MPKYGDVIAEEEVVLETSEETSETTEFNEDDFLKDYLTQPDEEDEEDEAEKNPNEEASEDEEINTPAEPSNEEIKSTMSEDEFKRYNEMSETMEKIMKNAGYDDFETFSKDMNEALEKKKQAEMGLDDESFSKHKEIEKREREIEQRESQLYVESVQVRATEFKSALDKAAAEAGVEVEKVFEELDKAGFKDPLELINFKNRDFLIKSAISPLISEKKIQEGVSLELSRNTLPTGLPQGDGGVVDTSLDMDALILESLKDL